MGRRTNTKAIQIAKITKPLQAAVIVHFPTRNCKEAFLHSKWMHHPVPKEDIPGWVGAFLSGLSSNPQTISGVYTLFGDEMIVFQDSSEGYKELKCYIFLGEHTAINALERFARAVRKYHQKKWLFFKKKVKLDLLYLRVVGFNQGFERKNKLSGIRETLFNAAIAYLSIPMLILGMDYLPDGELELDAHWEKIIFGGVSLTSYTLINVLKFKPKFALTLNK